MAVRIKAIDQDEFEQYPEPKTKPKEDPYADLIPLLQSEGFVEVTLTETTSMRGARIGIGRRAKAAGIAIQMRYDQERNQIAVQYLGPLIETEDQPPDPDQPKRRGRPKKQPEE
jgi:hypothetical protein